MNMIDHAKEYAAKGICVIPCKPRDKSVALPAWEEYQTRQSTIKEIEQWWASNPRYNIGLVHGVNGFVSIDIDHDTGALEEMRARFPELTSGRIEQSGSGQGYHILLFVTDYPNLGWDTSKDRPKGNQTWKTKFGSINIRARWCQTVAAPSVHPTGGVYKNIQEGEIVRTENLNTVIAWLNSLCPPPEKNHSTPTYSSDTADVKNRFADLVGTFAELGITGEVKQDRGELRILGHGGLMVNPETRQWFCFTDEVGGDVIDAFGWVKFGRAWDRHNKSQFAEVMADMRARAGIATPPRLNGHASPPPQTKAATQAHQSPASNTPPTHDELAQRWIAKHPLTAYGMGEFRRYSKGVWEIVPKDNILLEITRVLIDAKADRIRPTSSLVASVAEMSRVFVSRASAQWDTNKDIIVCTNGALHIPTLDLLAHNPEHYATSGLGYNYDPDATAPVWDIFLNITVSEAKDFLQEFAGYALTIDTSYETALWLYGPPGSGKSTFLTGLQTMLGARAGLLGLADIEKSRFALSQLPGKTLVVNTEQPAGYMQATYILNSLISGEPINVERKYMDAVEITPRAKVAWAMNDLPRISDAGNGLFRRVKVVKFSPLQGAPDPEIKETIKTEGAGILNWALEGLARLRKRGHFLIPECVIGATESFKHTNDVPGVFVSERCIIGGEYKTQSSELYAAYKEWAFSSGHKPQSSTSIAEEWARLGFERFRSNGKTYWRGVGILFE